MRTAIGEVVGSRTGPAGCALHAPALRSNVAAMATPRLQVIGGGKMGEALLAGLVSGGWADAGELRVVERLPGRAVELRDRFDGLDVGDQVADAAGHVVAVKPGDVEEACRALARTGSSSPVLSIAAGVTISRLEAALAPGNPVVRAMPNTPALVGAGAAAVAAGHAAGESDVVWAEQILGAVGTVVRVEPTGGSGMLVVQRGAEEVQIPLTLAMLSTSPKQSWGAVIWNVMFRHWPPCPARNCPS